MHIFEFDVLLVLSMLCFGIIKIHRICARIQVIIYDR